MREKKIEVPKSPAGDEVRAFAQRLAFRQNADRTIEKYVSTLLPFLTWIGKRLPGELKVGDFDDYLGWWHARFVERYGRKPAPATSRAQVTAIKAFFEYLERVERLVDAEGREVRNRAALLEAPRREVKAIDFLSPEEDDALLAYSGKPREEVFLWLLRFTGLRISEALTLRIGDVDLTEGGESVRVKQSKTPSGKRTIPINAELAQRLRVWIAAQTAAGLGSPNLPLLPTARRTPMHHSYAWRLLKRIAAQQGVRVVHCTCGTKTVWGHDKDCPRTVTGENRSEVTPHHLRRTYATTLLNADTSIEVVSKLLGHRTTAITQEAYAELLDDRVRKELQTGALKHIRVAELSEAA